MNFAKPFKFPIRLYIRKSKKYAAELEGHISKDKGNVFVLDPFAVNLLKPKKASYKALDERNYYLYKKNKEIVSENVACHAKRKKLSGKTQKIPFKMTFGYILKGIFLSM